jgi:hypothetical protein
MMRKLIKFIAIGFFVATLPLFFIACFQPKVSSGLPIPAAQINRLSREVTVEINGTMPGSGVIVGHGGGVYYVLTAQTVVESADSVEVIDPFGFSHTARQISELPGLDIALLSMESNDLFMQVQLAEARKSRVEDPAFLAGFNAVGAAISERRHQFSPGKLASASGSKFSINARTLAGFSGGPVFNEFGELIGVYQADGIATGISDILKASRELGIVFPDKPSYLKGSLKFQELTELPDSLYTTAMNLESDQSIGLLWRFGNGTTFSGLGFSKISKEGEPIFSHELFRSELNKESRVRRVYNFELSSDDRGTYYIAGYQSVVKPENNAFVHDELPSAFLASFSEDGRILLEKTFDQEFGAMAYDVEVDSDGNIILCGDYYTTEDPNTGIQSQILAWVAKFNSKGDLLWRRNSSSFLNSITIDSPDFVRPHSIVVNNIGQSYVAGFMNNQKHFPEDEGNFDAWVSKFSPDGNLLWSKKIGNQALESLDGLKIGPNETIFAWGKTTGSIKYLNSNERPNQGANEGPAGENNNTFWMMVMDKNDSLISFDQILNFTSKDDPGSVVGVDSDGNSYIVYNKFFRRIGSGNSLKFESEEGLRKYTSAGQLVWEKALEKPKFWSFRSFSVEDEHLYVLARDSSARKNNGGDFLIKYSIEE